MVLIDAGGCVLQKRGRNTFFSNLKTMDLEVLSTLSCALQCFVLSKVIYKKHVENMLLFLVYIFFNRKKQRSKLTIFVVVTC